MIIINFLLYYDENLDFDAIIPPSFVSHFYASTGRPCVHHLFPMIKSLLLQRIFSIPTDALLIIFLKYSQELRDFCGFIKVPDASKFTRFKQNFLPDLQSMFDNLVDLTEPICQQMDSSLASMTIFDTSGIEAFVTENNPLINPKTFLGDSAFDTIQIYHDLFHELRFQQAYIPLNNRPSLKDSNCPLNEEGVPCCPHDPTLPMKREGSKTHLRCGLETMKFVCPKMKWVGNKETKKSKRTCFCDNPCTDSPSGRMFYIYPEKICVHIPEPLEIQRNGIPLIKYV